MPPILPEIYLQASLAVSGPNIFCGGSLLTDRYIYSRGFWGFPLPNLHRQSLKLLHIVHKTVPAQTRADSRSLRGGSGLQYSPASGGSLQVRINLFFVFFYCSWKISLVTNVYYPFATTINFF